MNVKAFAATLGLASLVITPAPWPINGIRKPISPSTKPSRFPAKFFSPDKYVMKLAGFAVEPSHCSDLQRA